MSDPIAASPEYVSARRVLLNALFLMRDQIDAFVLVGAQAVYHHAPYGDSRALYTTDADLAINPQLLGVRPDLGSELSSAGFTLDENGNPGHWISPEGIVVDIMVPAGSIPESTRRTAPLTGQLSSTARRTRGLEAALHDNTHTELTALDETDERRITVRVAGPAALVIAKVVKIRERLDSGRPDRIVAKDAGDVLRLLRNVSPDEIGTLLARLAAIDSLHEQTADVVTWLESQLSTRRPTPFLDLASADLDGVEPASQVHATLRTLGSRMTVSFRRHSVPHE